MKHHTAIPEIKYYIINIIDSHQMYWSSDQPQKIGTTQNNNINIVQKRSTDQSLDLSLSRASENQNFYHVCMGRSSLFPHRPKPNGIHILKDHPNQVLSNHPSSLQRHLHPMQLNRIIIHNDGERHK